jgi:hypothetical protein
MNFIDALDKGRCLQDSVFWKKTQSLVNLVGGSAPLLCIVIPGLKEYLTVDNILALGSCIGAMNIYFTNATSTQVGL